MLNIHEIIVTLITPLTKLPLPWAPTVSGDNGKVKKKVKKKAMLSTAGLGWVWWVHTAGIGCSLSDGVHIVVWWFVVGCVWLFGAFGRAEFHLAERGTGEIGDRRTRKVW